MYYKKKNKKIKFHTFKNAFSKFIFNKKFHAFINASSKISNFIHSYMQFLKKNKIKNSYLNKFHAFKHAFPKFIFNKNLMHP